MKNGQWATLNATLAKRRAELDDCHEMSWQEKAEAMCEALVDGFWAEVLDEDPVHDDETVCHAALRGESR